MACVENALIVGGGIGGLAAAIALQNVGIQCTVVEIDMKPVGAGIGFAGRAPQALQALGVYEQACATGKPFTEAMKAPVTRDAAGVPMHAPPLKASFDGSFAPVGVHRPVFAEILLSRARECGAIVRERLSITRIEEMAKGALVTLTNGETSTADCVIGADGIGSVTRALVFPEVPEPEYAGQMSLRWLAPYPPIEPADWYDAGNGGRIAIHNQPVQENIYVPMVITMPERRLSQQDCFEITRDLLDQFTAPAIAELRERLTPDAEIIARPFKWLLVDAPWHRGRTMLIGDAAHATTAHMGMGGGMALEDAVVLADCIAEASNLQAVFDRFMQRRWQRVKTVVETSVAISKLEQACVPDGPERGALMGKGMAALSAPY
jgi:2-polyprenyl-6-methoxyphenol hydroxylase-like FAD-dependent oxidoreductase